MVFLSPVVQRQEQTLALLVVPRQQDCSCDHLFSTLVVEDPTAQRMLALALAGTIDKLKARK